MMRRNQKGNRMEKKRTGERLREFVSQKNDLKLWADQMRGYIAAAVWASVGVLLRQNGPSDDMIFPWSAKPLSWFFVVSACVFTGLNALQAMYVLIKPERDRKGWRFFAAIVATLFVTAFFLVAFDALLSNTLGTLRR